MYLRLGYSFKENNVYLMYVYLRYVCINNTCKFLNNRSAKWGINSLEFNEDKNNEFNNDKNQFKILNILKFVHIFYCYLLLRILVLFSLFLNL